MNEETVVTGEAKTESEHSGERPPEGDGSAASKPRPRRRRGGSGRSGSRPKPDGGQASQEQSKQKTDEAPAAEAAGDAQAPAAEGEGSATTPRPGRRRGRRGGRGRNRKPASATGGGASEEKATEAPAGADAPKKPAAAAATETATSGEGGEKPASTSSARRRRRRRSSGGGTAAKEAPAAEEAAKKSPPAKRSTAKRSTAKPAKKAAAEEDTSGPTRTRRVRTPGQRRRREPTLIPARTRDKTMLITEHGERDQIAVLEGPTLIEHYITRVGAHSMVGNIYLGRVQNVLPGMEAAFIDVGRGRNAVLYAGEVNWDEDVEGARRIEQALKPGQSVLVQVTKDPLGGKGARLTGEVSLPGRFLVMVPNSQVFGISRRLSDDERRRLRALARKLKPEGHGLIVRTAADGASEEDFAHDIERLVRTWEEIEKKTKKAKPPKVLYEEPELTVRVVRDLFNDEEFTEIVTDSVPVFDSVRTYLQDVASDLVHLVHLHDGKLSLFEEYHLVEQIHKALERKVWLPSGGYIVIDKTEAMTVIDVNTGKHVGKANLEETVTKTNIEAAEEIARQLRLRDIGGIIIIDFIDMLFERNKQKVIDMLKNELAQDKTRSQVFDIGPLGLLEVTRKRVSAGLLESFSETCPTCGGRGILLTHEV